MKRKREGASLIVVIIVFMFLTTVSTAMLSMVLANYKARISESNRVENLYASDSGLDVAYNVIGKNFDAAVKYGYYKVETLKDGTNTGPNNDNYQAINDDITDLTNRIKSNNTKIGNADSNTNLSDLENQIAKYKALIEEDKKVQQVLINEEFKRAFNNFIEKTNGNDAENLPSKQLESLIENHSYINSSEINEGNIDSFFQNSRDIIDFGMGKAAPEFQVNITPNNITYDSPQTSGITASDDGHKENVQFNLTPKHGYYDIAVTSSFYSEKLAGNDNNTNERQIKADFKLVVPEFSDIYYGAGDGYVEQYLATQDRAITVNGNMNLSEVGTNGSNGLKVSGEIYVGGTTPSVTASDRSYFKYNGGIMVYNSNVDFENNVITRNSLNLRSDANVTIGGNLYGRNVYVGGNGYDRSDENNDDTNLNAEASGAVLSVTTGQVVLDNDLALKASSSNITIKDFYGINDKNITDKDANGNTVDSVKSSSSIIVNSSDKSKIQITNSAYIMGTAHINTNENAADSSGNEYQTGESASVKGNYIAYTVPLDESEKLEYYDPLQLIGGETVIDKAKHFVKYWNGEIAKGNYPDTGGLQLPIVENADGSVDKSKSNVYTIGALVFEKRNDKGEVVERNVVDSTYYLDLENIGGPVYNAQAEFASKVYRFDEAATKPFDYDKTQVTAFTDLVDTDNISSSGYTLDSQSNNGEYAIFNGDSNKTVKIERSDDSSDRIIKDDGSGDIEIKVGEKDGKYTLNGVIVSAGNVSIDASDITINGCLIAGGDLNINEQNNININYDKGVIERVQAKNPDVFKAVFGQILVDDTKNTDGTDTSNNESNGSTAIDTASSSYDLKYFLEKKLWQIIK